MSRIRLYIDQPFADGQAIELGTEQAHYLGTVMRRLAGTVIEVFNGHAGCWLAEIAEISRKRATLTLLSQIAPQRGVPDLWLLFAPIKKARTDFIVEKATELGVARILPVRTAYTNSERVRIDRLQAHAVEAAEQCGGDYVPDLSEMGTLEAVLREWDPSRALFFADETCVDGGAAAASGTDTGADVGPSAILIGPEGGFSDAERALIRGLPFARTMSLGPRILRADTACVSAITLWQARYGDWQG